MLRRRVLFSLVLTVLLSAGFVFGDANKGEEAFTKLMDGNRRFVTGSPAPKDVGTTRRQELLAGQHPSAIILACSDSRVAPEIVFDQGLGDVFVIRVAGNVLDPVALGSIEYAAEHLHTPLLILLGHDKCGAVTAAIESKGKVEGNIESIVKRILPAVRKAVAEGGDKEEVLNNAIKENVLRSHNYLLRKSPILSQLVQAGRLKVVTAVYHLGSGEVEIVDATKASDKDKEKEKDKEKNKNVKHAH
jgi:carbonic anhydrase